MTEFLQQLLNGLSLGAIYALIALGYTMVYGVLGMINFAHGEVFMIGMFACVYAIARSFCEFFREPDAQLGFLWGGATMGQLLSIPLFLVGLGFIVNALKHSPLQRQS